jgi:hypothetical protein
MATIDAKCGYAHPGTYGHECGRPALFAGARPSDKTANGVFYAARCAECKDLTGPDNHGITRWEPLDLAKHTNQWAR